MTEQWYTCTAGSCELLYFHYSGGYFCEGEGKEDDEKRQLRNSREIKSEENGEKSFKGFMTNDVAH